MPFLLFLFTLLAGFAQAGETENALTVGNLPVRIAIPEGWTAEVMSEDPPEVFLQRRRPPMFASVGWTQGFQPAFERIDAESFASRVKQAMEEDGAMTLGEMRTEVTQRDAIGTLLLARGTGTGDGIEVEMLFGFFAVASGSVRMNFGARTQEDTDEAMEELLAGLSLIRPPLGDDLLGFGAYTAEVGFTIDLPDRLRAVTAEEARLMGADDTIQGGMQQGKHRHSVFIDPAEINDESTFSCTANSGASEVVDPAKSKLHEENHRARTRAIQRGGSFSTQNVAGRVHTNVNLQGAAVEIAPTAVGLFELVELGDREGYLWKVIGTEGDAEVTVLTLYTAWDNIGLDCSYYATNPDDPLLAEIEEAMRSIRVVDGEQHPMRLSMNAQYIKLWPFQHWLLQIWWFGALVCILGGLLTLWVLRP